MQVDAAGAVRRRHLEQFFMVGRQLGVLRGATQLFSVNSTGLERSVRPLGIEIRGSC